MSETEPLVKAPSVCSTESEEKTDRLRQILKKLMLERGLDGYRQYLTKDEIWFLCENSIESLKEDGTLAEIDPPVIICGDTHGQYYDLIRLFEHGGWPPESRYLFLGDYVDRGKQGVEVAAMMLALKMAFPHDFFVLRGNHECPTVNRIYGLWEECKVRYDVSVYWALNKVFAFLPLAGLVGERILCMHGGLSPDLKSLNQIRKIERPIHTVTTGMAADLLWSDPMPGIIGFMPSIRGVSQVFGDNVVNDFCAATGIDLIARAHQVVLDGYEFFAQGKLVTLFSAPNYCNQYKNAAAMMIVHEDFTCRITQLSLTAKEESMKSRKG